MKKFKYTLLLVKAVDVFADDLDEAIDRAAQEPTGRKDFVLIEHQRMEPNKPKEIPYRNN